MWMAWGITVFSVLAMVIQLIKPIGLPGLKRRSDFWKLPMAAFFLVVIVAIFDF